jgi:small subunit ribosomal protein S7
MRKAKPKKRVILPDPVFSEVKVTKFVNHLMYDGKKSIAFTIFYTAMDIVGKKLAEKEGISAIEVWKKALDNITPLVEVKSTRIGGATYQVPMEIRPERRQTLALRWIVDFARKRGEKTMADRLAGEIMDAANNTGAAVKRKEEMHRMAESNKAFAHYRW